MSDATIADRLWAAEAAVSHVEDEIYVYLISIFNGDDFYHFDTDASDRSIEIYGVATDVVLSENDQEKLRAAGFDRVWTHTHKTERRQPGERSYWLRKGDVKP